MNLICKTAYLDSFNGNLLIRVIMLKLICIQIFPD